MSDKLEVYDLNGKFLKTEDRKKFYSKIKKEFKKKGKITRQVKRIVMLLMNSAGRVYVQKRSDLKNENSGLFDKTIGGHVGEKDSYNMTLIKECAEELGFPASILPNKEFEKAIKITDLNIVGIFKKVDYKSNFLSTRITKKGKKFVQPYMNTSYIGYYDGPIKFVDGESSGILVFSIKKLKEELKKYPNRFTKDLKIMLKRYEKHLKPMSKR